MLYQDLCTAFKGHFSQAGLWKVWLHFSTSYKSPALSIQVRPASAGNTSLCGIGKGLFPRILWEFHLGNTTPTPLQRPQLSPGVFPALCKLKVYCRVLGSGLWTRKCCLCSLDKGLVLGGREQWLEVCSSLQLSSKIFLYVVKNTNFYTTFLYGGSLIWGLGHGSSVNFLLSCFDKRWSAFSLQFEFRDLSFR